MPDDVQEVPARRPSRWDRPKEPHDWRWVLGIVGRTLVSVGVLMFAFVAYQLWGTGIQTAREQSRLRAEFAELLETTVPVTIGTPATTIQPATSDPATSDPATSEAPADSTTTTPSVPIDEVPPAPVTVPEEGGPVAELIIPKMGISNKVVVQGVTPSDLQDGPGHFPETPLPGQLGNAAIAGHRTSHGQPFHDIDKLEAGDEITVITLAGQYVYVVTGHEIVDPNDYGLVIPTVDPTKATLTLTSCHPAHSTSHRIVVFAELDIARSSPVTQPTIVSDAEPSAALPGEDLPDATDQTETTDQTVSTDQTDDTVSPGAVTPPTTDLSPSDAAAADLAAAAETPPDDSVETFGNQWFSDPDAFPQVALWGVVLIAVSLGAYAVSRRARRNWVGALVGIVPFVVVLYFWFENVNRLLPPNL